MVFTLLRTKLLQRNYSYPVYIYDKDWYFGRGIRIGEISFAEFYSFFDEIWNTLSIERKKYVGRLNEADVEQIMQALSSCMHAYVVELLRYSIIACTETKEYLDMQKDECFEILSGEYYEPCHLIHREKQNKNYALLKHQLKDNGSDNYFEDYKGIDLTGFQGLGLDLEYADFRNSTLKNIILLNTHLDGAKFKDSDMSGCRLTFSNLHNASFENVRLENGDLRCCLSVCGRTSTNQNMIAGYSGTSFLNANLKGVDFTKAVMIGCDFRGADLTEAKFEQTKLKDSIFEECQLEKAGLTSEQRAEIKIYGYR